MSDEPTGGRTILEAGDRVLIRVRDIDTDVVTEHKARVKYSGDRDTGRTGPLVVVPDEELVRASGVRRESNEAGRTAVSAPLDLLDSLVDGDGCWLDHHGGCQPHGYLSLEPGELCPQAELKRLIQAARGGP